MTHMALLAVTYLLLLVTFNTLNTHLKHLQHPSFLLQQRPYLLLCVGDAVGPPLLGLRVDPMILSIPPWGVLPLTPACEERSGGEARSMGAS